ncbi:MAG: hypothetical protein AAGD38_22410 [Acidobacteriota bacterium]
MRIAILILSLVCFTPHLSAETIDSAFGDQGLVVTTFTDATDRPIRALLFDVAPLDDGRLLAVGVGDFGSYLLAARYLADGSLDSSYGEAGRLRLPVPLDNQGNPYRLEFFRVLPDGGFLAATIGDVPRIYELWRFAANGDRDMSFGVQGVVSLASWPRDIVLDTEGDFFVVSTLQSNDPTTFVQRFSPSGTADPGFGIDGVSTLSPETMRWHYGNVLTFLSDGRLLLAGGRDGDWGTGRGMFVMLTASGTLDTSWSDDGFLFPRDYDVFANFFDTVDLTPEGNVIGIGTANFNVFPDRLFMAVALSDGGLDTRLRTDPPRNEANQNIFRTGRDVLARPSGGYLVLSGMRPAEAAEPLTIFHIDVTGTVTPIEGLPEGVLEMSFESTFHGQGMFPFDDGRILVFGTREGAVATEGSAFLIMRLLPPTEPIIDIPTLSGLGSSLLVLLLGAAALIAMQRRE